MKFFTKLFKNISSEDNNNSFILFVALSFFILIPFAFFGAFSNVSFLVSFAFAGLFFTLYQMMTKRKGMYLFLGVVFLITVPQVLQLKAIQVKLKEIIMWLNSVLSAEISSISINNALTIASLGLVLYSLSRSNQQLKEIKEDNEKLTETVNQQEDWKMKYEQINQLDEIEEQVAALTTIIENETDSAVRSRSYAMRGNIYRKNDMLEKALDDVDEAIKLNPKYALAFFTRGMIQNSKGNKEAAVKDYTKAIELNPKYVVAYNNRGNAFLSMRKEEEALFDYTKAIELNPDYALAYYNRGVLLQRKEKEEEALLDYSKSIELNPHYADAYNNRANVFKSLGKEEAALNDYEKAIELNPKYGLAHKNRGKLYQTNGSKVEAISDYEKAIELNPDYEAELKPIIESLKSSLYEVAAAKGD